MCKGGRRAVTRRRQRLPGQPQGPWRRSRTHLVSLAIRSSWAAALRASKKLAREVCGLAGERPGPGMALAASVGGKRRVESTDSRATVQLARSAQHMGSGGTPNVECRAGCFARHIYPLRSSSSAPRSPAAPCVFSSTSSRPKHSSSQPPASPWRRSSSPCSSQTPPMASRRAGGGTRSSWTACLILTPCRRPRRPRWTR